MTRDAAVRWCMERGYCFVELYDGEIVYTKGQNIRRERVDDNT
jgi:hypothetical protein